MAKKKNNINVEDVSGTSQYDGMQVLKDVHSLPSHSLRTRDTLTLVKSHFDTFSVTYNSDNDPTKVEYFAGTSPHITEIAFVADSSGSLAGDYFLISGGRKSARYAVWYSVDGSGSAPGISDTVELEVAISVNDSAAVVAYATQLVLENLGDVFELDRTQAVLNIKTVDLGETNNTINNGTGFTITNTAGTSEIVETVNLTYSADGFPIWQGQELKNYKYDIYSGKLEQASGEYAAESIDSKITQDSQTGAILQRPTSDLMDSFGRTRVVEPVILFESTMAYNKRPNLFYEKFLGAGSSTHLPNDSVVELSVGTASGDQAIRQTRRYFRYQTARTHYKTYVAILGPPKVGVVSKVGSFDATDGFHFEVNENGLFVVRTDSTSGIPNEVKIAQSNWNIDTLDGTGPSGINIDTSKLIIYGDKFNWHGNGPVIMGVYLNGRFNACHSFSVGNETETPITALPNLPIRYEIVNVANTTSATSMRQGASSCAVDGGLKIDQSLSFAVNNDNTPRTVDNAAFVPILSIRPKAIFEGRVNRTTISPVNFEVQGSGGLVVNVVLDGVVSGGTWTDVGSGSTVEYNAGGTSFTGGRTVISRYVPTSGGGRSASVVDEVIEDLFITLDIDGLNPENITIIAKALSGASTVEVYSAFSWREAY